jgi:sulfide:quinone oxidoreductase
MAKVVIVGAGFAGHTVALYLGAELGKDHEISDSEGTLNS